jgi:hypothetical protein
MNHGNIRKYHRNLTAAARQIKSIVVVPIMIQSPMIMSVFLPAFSIKIKLIMVMATFIAPIPNVADWAEDSSKPADSKIDVEKKMAALIPDNCWANIIMTEMISGALRAPLVIISFRVTLGNSFMDSCSFFISSISLVTSWDPLNQVRALVAPSSLSLSNKRNLGDSGQNGKVASCKNPGIMVRPRRNGHPASLPRTLVMPKIWANKMEMVIISWYIVPTAPLRAVGEISDKYIGAKPALSPELMPMMSLPTTSICQDPAYLAPKRKTLAMAIRMLFKSNPPFL